MLANHPQAQQLAWERYLPMVSRMVYRAYGRGQDSEDVIQEIFLCVYRRVHTLRDPMALRAFVIAITHRTLSFELRKRRARQLLTDDGAAEGLEDKLSESASPEAQHALSILRRLLSRLRLRDRRAFELRYLGGMNADEVAEALGVSAPTARRSFSRARRRLNLWASRHPILADFMPAGSRIAP